MNPLLLLTTAVLMLIPILGSAHDWYTTEKHLGPNGTGSAGCCGGTDCAEIAPDAVNCDAEGCDVTIMGGQHPRLPASVYGTGPYVFHWSYKGDGPVGFSPDGTNAACLLGGSGSAAPPFLWCLWVGGSS